MRVSFSLNRLLLFHFLQFLEREREEMIYLEDRSEIERGVEFVTESRCMIALLLLHILLFTSCFLAYCHS